jgi:hypothetical protein
MSVLLKKMPPAFARTAPCKLVSGHAVERCQYLPKADLRIKPVEVIGGEPACGKATVGLCATVSSPSLPPQLRQTASHVVDHQAFGGTQMLVLRASADFQD